jgi:HAD superfamily hydrolase (TIGR01549 family)
MDGVLIDTSQSYDNCIIKTFEYFTKKQLNASKIVEYREKGGFNNDWDLTRGLINQTGFEVEYEKIVEQFQNFYQQLKRFEVNLIDSKNSYFNGDFTSAIITGRPKPEALDGVNQLQIQPDFIISADDVRQQKPSPEGINWLKSKTQKSTVWFCGDTVDDMQAGKASNCVCIGIGQNRENLYQAGADIVLDNINQLSELL